MSDPKPNRPEHGPRGYDWLPDIYAREVGVSNSSVREIIRQAFAEGATELMLRTQVGERFPIPFRMWDKEPVAEKVYPRFEDGWMKMQLLSGVEAHRMGTMVAGWIFIKKSALEKITRRQGHTHKAGRKTEKVAILKYYKELRESKKIDYGAPQNRVYEQIREKADGKQKGFGDEAIRKVITKHFQSEKEQVGRP